MIKKIPILELTEKCQSQIQFGLTEILFDNNVLESKKLINQINEFKDIFIEIKYPSKSFQSIYDILNKMKSKSSLFDFSLKKVKIAIFISEILETDQKFNNNANIDYVRIDT